jgi:hypothetical protein
MKNSLILLTVLPSLILSLHSCDKVDGPFREGLEADTVACPLPVFPVGSGVKNVLLEDFTGHTCGNCPEGHDEAELIRNSSGGRIIIMEEHVGYFALPRNYPDSSFSYDFRCDAAKEISDHFGNDLAGIPNGMVNRKAVKGSRILSKSEWQSAVLAELNALAVADLSVVNEYDAESRKLCTHVKTRMLQDYEGVMKLALFVVEDSIVNWQKDYRRTPENVKNYLHRHVLRAGLSGGLGIRIGEGTLKKGKEMVFSAKTYLDKGWNSRRCSVVAVLIDGGQETVLQVEEKNAVH